jgi:cell division protein FtsL
VCYARLCPCEAIRAERVNPNKTARKENQVPMSLFELILAGFINAFVLSFIIRSAVISALKADRESQTQHAEIDPETKELEQRKARIYRKLSQTQQNS